MQIEASYPLSPLQHGMLVHSMTDPGSGAYIQQLVCSLARELNISAFENAWRQIVTRHAVFRTSFDWKRSTPHQDVHQEVELPFLQQDWSGLAEEQQAELLEDFLTRDRQRGFEFDQPPLSRHAIFRFGRTDYRWVWTSHHALLDGRSRLLVLKEFFLLYEGFCAGVAPGLERPCAYRHFVDWYYRQDFSASERYWRERLSGFTSSTPLGIQRRLVMYIEPEDCRYAEQGFQFSERFTSQLTDVALQNELTPNTFLQGAWALLLSRYSGERNVVFGATRAGRQGAFAGAESIIGLLINTVPVRVDLDGSNSVLDWLKQLRLQWIALREHEHTPLVDVQKCSEIPSEKPLYESLLNFENYQIDAALRTIARPTQVTAARLIGSTNYPLSVAGYLGRQLNVNVVYDRSRFEDAAITTMLGHLKVVLAAMISGLDSPVSKISLLSAAERRRLLVEWNDTAKDYPSERCFQELFEEQVERTPDAVAIAWENHALTYRELNRRANQVAHYLRKSGVSRDQTVGIYASKSPQIIIAILGVLKAGGAYVPLNPMLPDEQLSWLITDSNPLFVITDEKHLKRASQVMDLVNSLTEPIGSAVKPPVRRLLCLDETWKSVVQESDQNLKVRVMPGNLAYVIYTSGSTGKAKGTMIEHRSLVNYLNWINQSLLSEGDVVLPTMTNLAFDASLKQVLAPLLRGREVWIVPEELANEPLRLFDVLQERSNVGINCVPSLWRVVLDALKSSKRQVKTDSVNCLFLGGEAVSIDLINETLTLLPQVKIWNLYGPTETTVNVSSSRLRAWETVTIGRPIANVRIYVLDEKLEPAPIGVTGELHIEGICLARGYLNHPQMTAEKFVPNPFSRRPGARMYKTGDLARYRPDGSIEYVGREDHQVKVRGFRVELEDVETILKQHPAVADAAVLAREEFEGRKVLVACVVPCKPIESAAADIDLFLRARLPEYAVPSYFLRLKALPLNAVGKVDRRALARLEPEERDTTAVFEPPRTATEVALAQIWCDVLGVKRVGIRDNFFGLGGHSLLATGVLSRVCNRFKIDLPIRTIFENATLASLAAAIDGIKDNNGSLLTTAIRAIPRRLQRLNLS
jgi:amino acid adenylation domain-containing protein